MPVYSAQTPKVSDLYERGVDAHRLRRDRLVADRDHAPGRCGRAAGSSRARTARPRPGEREEIEPLVLSSGSPNGASGLTMTMPCDAAGPLLEALVFQDLRHRDAEREGGEREVQAFEPQRRQAEQEAGDEADHAGDRDRRPVRHAGLVHQDRRRVGADRVEGAMAERDLAVVAGQHVEAEQRDRIDQHQRELEHVIVAERRTAARRRAPAAATPTRRATERRRSLRRRGARLR